MDWKQFMGLGSSGVLSPLYCKDCGKKLEEYRAPLGFNEHTGEKMFGPVQMLCPDRDEWKHMYARYKP